MYLVSHLDQELTTKSTVISSPQVRRNRQQPIRDLQHTQNMPATSSNATMSSVRTRSMIKDRRYFAEKIVREKLGENGKPLYLVKWEGYPLDDATWEPRRNLTPALMSAWRVEVASKAKAVTDENAQNGA